MDGRAAEAMVPRSNSDPLQLRRVSGATLTGLMLSATAMDAGNRGKLGVALSGAVASAETIEEQLRSRQNGCLRIKRRRSRPSE